MRIIKLAILSLFSFLFLSLPALAGPSPGDKITDFAINKLNGLFDAVKTALPTVTKYTLQVTSMGCTVDLLTGATWTILSGIVGYIVYRLAKFSYAESPDHDKWFAPVFVSFIGGVPTTILFTCGMTYLLDFWSWICVTHPDAYLIHLAVQKIVH